MEAFSCWEINWIGLLSLQPPVNVVVWLFSLGSIMVRMHKHLPNWSRWLVPKLIIEIISLCKYQIKSQKIEIQFTQFSIIETIWKWEILAQAVYFNGNALMIRKPFITSFYARGTILIQLEGTMRYFMTRV